MAKKSKEQAPLTPEEVVKYKPEDQVAKLQGIMGFDLTTAYKAGLGLDSDNPAVVAGEVNPKNRVANVDALPETKK